MKFSHSLRVNSHPDWLDYYLSYDQLKKLIYRLEREELESRRQKRQSSRPQSRIFSDSDDAESQPLISTPTPIDSKGRFTEALNAQLNKIDGFYIEKLDAFVKELANLKSAIAHYELNEPAFREFGSLQRYPIIPTTPTSALPLILESGEGSDSPENTILQSGPFLDSNSEISDAAYARQQKYQSRTLSLRRRHTSSASSFEPGITEVDLAVAKIWANNPDLKGMRSRFKQELTNLFIVLSELKEYVNLNRVGFSKILKKFDKVLKMKLKDGYLAKVDLNFPFLKSSEDQLDDLILDVVDMYTIVAANGDFQEAKTRLKQNLHERVVFERSTVWGDMVERERKTAAVQFEGDGPEVKKSRAFTVKNLALWIGIVASGIVLNYGVMGSPEQDGCLSIVIFALTLWGFEIIPLFATGIVIPLLIVGLRVLREPINQPHGKSINSPYEPLSLQNATEYRRLTANEAAKKIFSDMWSPVIMLLLGGFALAAALSKHNIAKIAATWIIGKAGNKRSNIIFVNMLVSTFISMWISNVAAPVLCYSLISPVLRTLNLNDKDQSSYAAALVMGIAMAANVGGMASPIASPQNIIAINIMNPAPSWGQWFAVSIPVCLCIDIIAWLIILFVFDVKEFEEPVIANARSEEIVIEDDISFPITPIDELAELPEVSTEKRLETLPIERKKTVRQVYVTAVLFITIILWCSESILEEYVGDMGVIAIFPLIAFFAFPSILSKEDFHAFPWTVVMLAMGGICLGKAVQSSGLLASAVGVLTPWLVRLTSGNVWLLVVLMGGIIGVVTSMISHTVGALIILPVVYEIGVSLIDPRPNTLVFASALMCSGAMGLPISSFPNMAAITLETPTGTPYVRQNQFIITGILCTLTAFSTVITIGWVLMQVVQFK